MSDAGVARNRDVVPELAGDARSIGALHGSARGDRNVSRRLQALSSLGLATGNRLLDVGCGTGEYTRALALSFERTDAIEIERERLELFRESKPVDVELHYMSINQLEFEASTFDVVVMIEVLEHLVDVEGALSEIARVLKPGGSLFLTTPARRWPLEQHGVLIGDRRVSGVFAPGLVWVKPLHRRFSDATAFGPSDLRALADASGLHLDDYRFMMPPLDSLEEGHRAHVVFDWLEDKANSRFGQTIVAKLDRPH